MIVAFTTSRGTTVDQNFKKASSFSIWDINPDGSYYVQSVTVKDDADTEEDRILLRANALIGCTIVCAQEINGPATAKLISRNIHPIKTVKPTSVEAIIEKLQNVLRGAPAPWLRKTCLKYEAGNDGAGKNLDILDVTVADLLGRYPETRHLLLGSGLSLFPNEETLSRGGIVSTVKDALRYRGISEDLFTLLLAKEVSGFGACIP
ncbi:MAG: NifB/NifX family molybdenum-iron cluster-binding protein [Pedobacter sp.]